jgi:hypothetical protein
VSLRFLQVLHGKNLGSDNILNMHGYLTLMFVQFEEEILNFHGIYHKLDCSGDINSDIVFSFRAGLDIELLNLGRNTGYSLVWPAQQSEPRCCNAAEFPESLNDSTP